METEKKPDLGLSLGRSLENGCPIYVLKEDAPSQPAPLTAKIFWDMRPVNPGQASYLDTAEALGLGQSPSLKGLWRERLN